jgi:hypothetical protein
LISSKVGLEDLSGRAIRGLDPVIAQATHKNPDMRYPTVLAMVEDVRLRLKDNAASVFASGKLPLARPMPTTFLGAIH